VTFTDCNEKDDGFFFKFNRNNNRRVYYIMSDLGNLISYKSEKLFSAIFKKKNIKSTKNLKIHI
jgi:hypothetical protein